MKRLQILGFRLNFSRMLRPLLLSEGEDFDTWLNGAPDKAFELIRTYDSDRMRIVQSGPDKAGRLEDVAA